jgi:hypothetical protein
MKDFFTLPSLIFHSSQASRWMGLLTPCHIPLQPYIFPWRKWSQLWMTLKRKSNESILSSVLLTWFVIFSIKRIHSLLLAHPRWGMFCSHQTVAIPLTDQSDDLRLPCLRNITNVCSESYCAMLILRKRAGRRLLNVNFSGVTRVQMSVIGSYILTMRSDLLDSLPRKSTGVTYFMISTTGPIVCLLYTLPQIVKKTYKKMYTIDP